jgi:hypothetical protein
LQPTLSRFIASRKSQPEPEHACCIFLPTCAITVNRDEDGFLNFTVDVSEMATGLTVPAKVRPVPGLVGVAGRLKSSESVGRLYRIHGCAMQYATSMDRERGGIPSLYFYRTGRMRGSLRPENVLPLREVRTKSRFVPRASIATPLALRVLACTPAKLVAPRTSLFMAEIAFRTHHLAAHLSF